VLAIEEFTAECFLAQMRSAGWLARHEFEELAKLFDAGSRLRLWRALPKMRDGIFLGVAGALTCALLEKLLQPQAPVLVVILDGNDDNNVPVVALDVDRLPLGGIEQEAKTLFCFGRGENGHAFTIDTLSKMDKIGDFWRC